MSIQVNVGMPRSSDSRDGMELGILRGITPGLCRAHVNFHVQKCTRLPRQRRAASSNTDIPSPFLSEDILSENILGNKRLSSVLLTRYIEGLSY